MDKKKVKKLNDATAHLFKMVTEKDFITNKGGRLFINGRVLDQKETLSVVEQARVIKSLPLWGIMLNEMIAAANKKIYFDSLTIEDVMFGKATLWSLDILAKKIENLSNFPVKEVSTKPQKMV